MKTWLVVMSGKIAKLCGATTPLSVQVNMAQRKKYIGRHDLITIKSGYPSCKFMEIQVNMVCCICLSLISIYFLVSKLFYSQICLFKGLSFTKITKNYSENAKWILEIKYPPKRISSHFKQKHLFYILTLTNVNVKA